MWRRVGAGAGAGWKDNIRQFMEVGGQIIQSVVRKFGSANFVLSHNALMGTAPRIP